MCGYQFKTTTKRSINASRLGQNKMLGSNFSNKFNHLNMKIASNGKAYLISYEAFIMNNNFCLEEQKFEMLIVLCEVEI